MQEHNNFNRKETRLDHDLHDGDKTHAAVSLLREFEKNPREALALVQKEMKKQSAGCADASKLHLAIQDNGDVIVWDRGERNGYYAGHVPDALREKPAQPAPPVAPITELPQSPASVTETPPPPPTVTEVPVPPPPPPVERSSGPQAYEYQQPHHRGFHIPCPIDIGVRDGSFHLGVNVLGLVKGGVSLGQRTRGYVGSDALDTEVSAGVDLNKEHVGPAADWRVLGDGLTTGRARVGITPGEERANIGAGIDASALGRNVAAGGHGGLEVGNRFGPHADAYAKVLAAEAKAGAAVNLSDEGLRADSGVDVGAQPYVGVHAQERFGLGKNNELHADAGANVGDNGVATGAGFYPQVHPDIYVNGHTAEKEGGLGLNPARAWSRNTDENEK